MWRYVLVVCTLAAWSPGVVSQLITQQPMSTAPLLVGETASFSCAAESFPVSNITWFRVESGPTDIELMDNGADITIMSEVAGNTTSSSLSVLVQGAEDFTQYFCVADNGFDNETSDTVDLVQAVLQSVAVSPQTQDVNIDEVPSITLSCTVTTDRPADTTIEWTSSVRSGVLATGTGTSLDLDQNTADLAVGEQFTCTAMLGTGSMSDTAIVNIYTPITVLEPPTDTDPLLVGEVAMFTTTVRSVPAPEVTWMQQIPPQLVPLVPDGDSINVTLQNLSSTTYMSVLFLRVPEILPVPMLERYFALFENGFTMIGNPNEAGLLIRAVLSSVTVSPAFPTINIDQQVSITLSCVVDANRDVEIEWTSNVRTGVVLASGTGLSLNLTQNTADLAHQEELTCTATLGSTIVSDTAAVTTFSFVNITQQPMSTAPLLVGETASFSCEAESRPAPNITWFRVESGSALMLVDDGVNITITPVVADNTTSSNLSVLVQGAEDFTQYFCVADNSFNSVTSTTVDLVQAVAPSFLEQPADVTLIAGEVASLNCTATGPPLPSITWEDGEGNSVTDNDVFNITVEVDGMTVSSFLEFVPNVTEAGYRCIAENRVNRTESRLAIVIIAGPPGSPAPVNASGIGPRGANVSWTLPPSLLPITEYQITILLNETNSEVFNRTLQSGDAGFEERLLVVVDLQPVTGYVAEVAAVNRAGVGDLASVTFTTLEDVLQSVVVSPQTQDVNIDEVPSITLSCTVATDRAVNTTIEWTSSVRPGVLATGTGTSLDLNLDTADLADVEMFTCTATLGDMTEVDTATVNAFTFVSITQQPMSTVPLLVGETASFSCEAESRPAPTIAWFRVESGPTVMLVDDGVFIRITPVVTDDTSSSSLSVLVQGAEDFTQYFCVADNGFDNETSDTVNLVQAVLQSVVVSPPTQDVNIDEVSNITLNCTVATNRPANTTIEWTSSVRSGVLDTGTGTSLDLDLDTADLADVEMFNCTATLGDMTAVDTATVNAYTFVNITQQPMSTAPLLMGETASFSCEAESRPAPSITWFRVESGPTDVQLMDNGADINITSEVADNTTSSSLSVLVQGAEDFTQYFCVADNSFDNETSVAVDLVQAVLQSVAVSPQTQDVNIDEVSNITLNCNVTTNRPVDTTIEWTSSVRSGVLANGTGTSLDLDLDTADLADVEMFSCTATLGDMTAVDTATVNAYTFVSITQQPMSTAQLMGETASFSCEAESRPAPSITWFRVESGPTDVQLMNNGADINITSVVTDNTTSSSLSVLVQGAEDFTQYFCVADNDFDNVTSDMADLVQAVLQSVAVSPLTQDVNIDEVSNITLNCNVTTNRPVDTNIEWTSNVQSGVLANGTGTSLDLDLDTADLADVEMFNCTATLGDMTTVDTATVNAYTFVSITQQPMSTAQLVGEIASFSCEAESRPAPSITWFRVESGSPLMLVDDGMNITITSVVTGNTTSSSLSVLVQGAEDFTQYFCVADNGFDNQTSDMADLVQAVLQSVAVSPLTQDVNIDEVSNITLNCNVTTNSPAGTTIEWTSGVRPGVLANGTGTSLDLDLDTADLADVEMFNCTATLGDMTAVDTATVNAYTFVNITQQPMSTAPLLMGETASFSCEAESRPPPSITWFRVESGSPLMLVDDGVNINITSEVAGNTASSSLSVLVQGAEDFTQYFCVADNGFDNETSTTVDLVQAVAPSFLEEPADVTLIAGEVASLNCTATGPPLPSITWEDGVGNSVTDDDVFNITVEVDGMTVSSFLEFVPNVTEAGYRCIAENRVNRTESRLAIVIIAGPPGSPAPVIASDIGPRGANVSWTLPPSLLPITEYQITILLNVNNSEVFIRTLQSGDAGFEERQLVVGDLRPVTGYVAEVAAVNRAGVGNNASVTFTTLEDVPEAPPTGVTTSARIARQILVEWGPPPVGLQNGVITQYTVQFQNSSGVMQTNTATAVTSFNLINLTPGVTYDINVTAHTMVGPGPFSNVVQQMTLSEPPEFPNETIPEPPRGNITTSTFTFGISVPPGEFSHFWVIIVRLAATTSPDQFPMLLNNDSFVNFTTFDPVPIERPYIAAEISAVPSSALPSSFRAGDSASTEGINDIDIYVNGPLLEGTRYTAFIWGFAPAVPGSQDARRRREDTPLPRQYSSFSSSSFVPPIFTATDTGLSPGAVAGIVIGIVLAMVLVGAIVILLLLVFGLKRKPDWGPPPSRKGSVRLRDFRDTAPKIKAETELQDLNPDDVRLPVPVEDFEGHVKKMHANTDHLFSEEYEIIQIKSPSLPHIQCSMPFNVNKNRYANINCYDESRVHLTKIFGVDGSDYINANYIHGFQQKQAYIATQGPLPNTTQDFWRMVWEFRSCCIIMLTNLVEKSRAKCHQYWPEAGSVSFGELTVTIIDTQELAYYSIRTFRMNRGNDRREVKQFHYTGWPDFGVPDHPHPVISFIRRISNFKRTHDGPDIIHCSAGVGRTGTLITIQAMLAMMSEEGKVDIFNFVLGMRSLRNYMVQTERQYIFIHDAVMELLRMGETEVPIQNLRRRFKELQAQDPESELSGLEKEYLHIKELSVVDKSQFSSAKMTVNLGKNRFPDIFPYDDYRVRLLMHPGVSGSDYINASYVDGYQQRQQYIVTQGPMKHTVDDFWRMIWEHRVCAILMMCQLEEKGKEQCVRYWPSDKIRQHGDLFIELTQEQEFSSYTMREFSVTNTKLNESRVVKHYQFVDWSEDSAPANAAGIIDLIGVLQKTQHMSGRGPIVAHDSIPTGRAGTFCVLSNMLEQLKVEGIVDLFFAVYSLRQQQPGIVHTIDEYKFCYTAVLEFLDSFDHYANFD